MVNPLSAANQFFFWNVHKFEESLFPLENSENYSSAGKVINYGYQFFKAAFYITLFTISIPLRVISKFLESFNGWGKPLTELEKFEINPDWKNTKIDQDIEIGSATSAYQIEGGKNFKNSTWKRWEDSHKKDGSPCVEGEKSGRALDFWHHPEELIDKLKELGLKHYRFSIEWSAIQPTAETTSLNAVEKYIDLCKRLKSAGIEPFITLHHFSDPIWFLDKGGFEKEDNICDFVNFSKTIFEIFSPHVKEWATFNEPTIYAFQGYVQGEFPPGAKSPERAGIVLKNLMIAHCKTYDALKALDVKGDSLIGITHQALRFRPYHTWEPVENLVCHYLSQMTHQIVMDFFKTGVYKFQIPFMANVTYSNPEICNKIDFFGVQYYTDPLISWTASRQLMDSTCYPHEKMTKMPFRFYPQGLATVLEECKGLGKEVWITETGAATNPNDQKEFIRKIFKTISFAKKAGVPVNRILIWSVIDNFEWNLGWSKRFGLFSFDPTTKKSALRLAGEYLKKRIELSSEGQRGRMNSKSSESV